MNKKIGAFISIIFTPILLGGCHKMNNQNTEKSSQSSSQAKTYTAAEIKQNQIKFLKAHEEEIKNYILAGIPKDVAAQVTDFQIDYDSLENQFDEGAAGFGATYEYQGTLISYQSNYFSETFSDKFILNFNDYKEPRWATFSWVDFSKIYYIDNVRGGSNIWTTPTQSNEIGGK